MNEQHDPGNNITANSKKKLLLSSQQLVVFSEDQVIKKCKHTFQSYTCILSG